MKTNKLSIDYEFDFGLLALVSSDKEYKLAWHINHLLSIFLEKKTDIVFELTKDRKLVISNYYYATEFTNFRLLKNKAVESEGMKKPFLVDELIQYDYFLRIESENPEIDMNLYVQKLKKISSIQLIKNIEIEKLISKENLLF